MIINNVDGITVLYAEGTNKITNSERSFFSNFIYLGGNDNAENYTEVHKAVWKNFVDDDSTDIDILNEKVKTLEEDNEVLKKENLSLLRGHFDLDFRVFELEWMLEDMFSSNYSIKAMKSIVDSPASNQYVMAKKIIEAGSYKRTDIEYKLGRYLDKNVITKDEYDELIILMNTYDI